MASSPEEELISPTDRQCADGIDNDGDQNIDRLMMSVQQRQDLCETYGFMRCATNGNNNEPIFAVLMSQHIPSTVKLRKSL